MSLQQYYDNFAKTGAWSDPEAEHCGCRGGGWWHSELDTLHQCRYHYKGQPSSEDSEEDWNEYEAKQIMLGEQHEKNMPHDYAIQADKNAQSNEENQDCLELYEIPF